VGKGWDGESSEKIVLSSYLNVKLKFLIPILGTKFLQGLKPIGSWNYTGAEALAS
jgi:hypothetical protein